MSTIIEKVRKKSSRYTKKLGTIATIVYIPSTQKFHRPSTDQSLKDRPTTSTIWDFSLSSSMTAQPPPRPQLLLGCPRSPWVHHYKISSRCLTSLHSVGSDKSTWLALKLWKPKIVLLNNIVLAFQKLLLDMGKPFLF